jgi:hypothetical protein
VTRGTSALAVMVAARRIEIRNMDLLSVVRCRWSVVLRERHRQPTTEN